MRGHFGPINALDVHPFGRSFASGSEDGYVTTVFVLFVRLLMVIPLVVYTSSLFWTVCMF